MTTSASAPTPTPVRAPDATAQAAANQERLSQALRLVRRFLLPALLVIEFVTFTALSPQFLTAPNLLNIVTNASDLALIAAGLTLVILLGGIDVSTGFAVGLVAWLVGTMLTNQVPPVLVLIAAVAAGTAIGLLNGTLVAKLSIPSIVATLGTSAIFQTLLFALWNSSDVFSGPVFPFLSGQAKVLGVPILVIIVLAIYLVLNLVLTNTKLGRSIYAIGSNREAAVLSGINVSRVRIICYTILGALVGLAACTYLGRVGVVQASSGNELTLLAIAAVVVGGTSILGGEGSLIRTLGGLIFIVVLQNGVVLAGVPPLWNGLMVGFVILLAVSIDGLVVLVNSRKSRNLS
jgi:ribose/xylose/arabinose/galactoside ABC-type transport system permease subunit